MIAALGGIGIVGIVVLVIVVLVILYFVRRQTFGRMPSRKVGTGVSHSTA